ncbi:DUF4878 domain-containing protein [Nitrosomonas aestuarii]|uniref:DUF4878 domain-containing protein n=1 Tax=Nitrosomonas aestuarii TaxID=52441 RepID=UPI000D2F4E44|nr:DUF4878 domain-containing protein [Nitrosomonas aestuarii]PTN11576.1 uncharacterized protein DUF4878 [Nitrosomonas aestuarii]
MMTYKNLLQIFYQSYTKHRVSRLTGIFSLLFILSGCQTILTPEQATTTFWKAMANGDLESAKKYTTQETQYLVTKQENIMGASLETGVIVIDGLNAKVATVIMPKNPESNQLLSFDTVLLKENDVWKVDYRQTLNNFSILPFGDVINSLRAIGDVINEKLEQQMPFFENQIRSFSDQLIRQLDEFRHQLEKTNPAEKQ